MFQALKRVLQQHSHLWPYHCAEKPCNEKYLTQAQLKSHCFKVHKMVSSLTIYQTGHLKLRLCQSLISDNEKQKVHPKSVL